MINRHTTYYLSELKPLNFCGKVIGHEANVTSFEPPFEMKPTEGEHDFTTCEGCQKRLAELTKRLTVMFEGNEQKKAFPFCCSYHSNLENIKEYSRAYFVNVPEMVAKKIIYTNQHIINNRNSENWYKKITDYIDYTIESFGQMPTGCGERLYLSQYFFYITDLLKKNKDVQIEKKNRILEYLILFKTPTENTKTDWNILLNTYEKWIKEFPFELNIYFGNSKQYFEKQLPLLNGKLEVNIYSGLAKAKMHTESSLIEALINLTKELLNKINVRELVEQGVIPDLNKHRFELECESLRIATGEITKDFSKGELKYIKALKKWLQLHKEYFKEITPLLKALPPAQTETKTDKLKAVLGKHGFFDLPKVKQLKDENKVRLVELISSNDLPYCIAMFDFLEYLKYLGIEHFTTKCKLNKEISKWFNSDKDGRAVKGNISTLSEYTKEDKSKYTAHLHKETVQNDYQNLK